MYSEKSLWMLKGYFTWEQGCQKVQWKALREILAKESKGGKWFWNAEIGIYVLEEIKEVQDARQVIEADLQDSSRCLMWLVLVQIQPTLNR